MIILWGKREKSFLPHKTLTKGGFMESDVLKDLMKEAIESGRTVDEVVKEFIAKEEEKAKEMIRIQIMPYHSIAGFGAFPTVGFMLKEKAFDLAKYGKVKIIYSDKDILAEDDEEAIKEHQEEMLRIRRSKEKGNRPVYSRLTNRKIFKHRIEEERVEEGEERIPTFIEGEESLVSPPPLKRIRREKR